LQNLLVSPSIKRRIRRRAIKDYLGGEHQNPLCLLIIAPTTHRSMITSWAEDYWEKSHIPGEYIDINLRVL
jgi:hypothetical protein